MKSNFWNYPLNFRGGAFGNGQKSFLKKHGFLFCLQIGRKSRIISCFFWKKCTFPNDPPHPTSPPILSGGVSFSAIWGGSGFLTAPPDLRNMGGQKNCPPWVPKYGGAKTVFPIFVCRFFENLQKKFETFFFENSK